MIEVIKSAYEVHVQARLHSLTFDEREEFIFSLTKEKLEELFELKVKSLPIFKKLLRELSNTKDYKVIFHSAFDGENTYSANDVYKFALEVAKYLSLDYEVFGSTNTDCFIIAIKGEMLKKLKHGFDDLVQDLCLSLSET